ncbi:steryl acetyl hydrolase domain-containing protein [Trichoderma breve]|uniref:Steryl acetyl hydrolase domain-containing protein n=1 Tax=Trichoderma breve TaxID=2034170 RepID=A0A9W9BDN1_9HYPO|nr:steryl acetyl hydrolase domain-containing protein [Trichoderma breve]KAJ4858435.1 steryl acetyl hydrolase domain-containing protein [Trichoderma breve]
MILGPVSLIDCLVFCIYLAPQLLYQAGFFPTAAVVIRVIPFLLVTLPIQFVWNRYCRSYASHKSSYLKGSTIFEDVVIRCVRYAFASIPANVGRVFFSKDVALPFLRWRMKRHGFKDFPVYWKEETIGEGDAKVKGIWIKQRGEDEPDIVIYYAHGGGFAMGSSYFYFEFLLAWHSLLVDAGYQNPAIFALDYSLVPDEIYPTQILQTLQGYKHVLEVAKDASKVCVAGDSAGGTLILSMLLEKGMPEGIRPDFAIPRMAMLISPWITLASSLHFPSPVDYLNRGTLWKYGHQYAGDTMIHGGMASPGRCDDVKLWKAASPERGYFITYGGEEVLAPDIENFVGRLGAGKVEIEARRFDGAIHAWPVASLFLSSTRRKRLYGLRTIVGEIRKRFDKAPAGKVKWDGRLSD